MSLTTWQELHAPAVLNPQPAALVYQRVSQRIHDSNQPMPPADRTPLTEAEVSALDIWLSAGAPKGEACKRAATSDASPRDGGDGGEGSEGTSQEAGAPGSDGSSSSAGGRAAVHDGGPTTSESSAGAGMPKAGAAATSDTSTTPPNAASDGGDGPVVPNDSECEYIDLLARSDVSGAPFQIPANAKDEYNCFIFDQNFDGPRQALAVLPVLDNQAVVHHWILYTLDAVGSRDITAKCQDGYAANYKVIAGGGPGTDPWYLPKDVGLDLGRGLFMLEVHYNNSGRPATTDRSGARICATRTLRRNTATISWLGAELFNVPAKATDYTVSNICRPKRQEPIHVLRYWPHMNQLGKRTSLRVDRPDGTSESLHNAPYSIGTQRSYPLQYVVQPGESIVATCYYDNPGDSSVGIGLKANDEMCNHFVVAYPAGALTNRGLSAWTDACVGAP